MGYPAFQRARAFKYATRTSGDVTIAVAGTFAVVDAALDLTLEAQVGDVIEFTPNYLTNSTSGAIAADVATVVAGSAVNYFAGSATGNGVGAWYAPASVTGPVTGPYHYTLVAGDITGGLVTVRLVARAITATKNILAQVPATGWPLRVFAQNIGPADPH